MMPQALFQETPAILAVIDMGSNAIRWLAGELQSSGVLSILASGRAFLRLGNDVFEGTGEISEATQITLEKIFSQFASELQVYQPLQVKIFATSAVRQAHNRKAFVQRFQSHTGWPLEVLSGEAEADYVRTAVQNIVAWGPEHALLADLGGGSLELSGLAGERLEFQQSFPIGGLRYRAEEFESGQPPPALQKTWQHTLQCLQEGWPAWPPCPHLILTGGNAKVIGRLLEAQGKNEGQPPHAHLSWVAFEKIISGWLAFPSEALMNLRAEQQQTLPLALWLFAQLGKIYHCQQVHLPRVGLKEGALLRFAQEQTGRSYALQWSASV